MPVSNLLLDMLGGAARNRLLEVSDHVDLPFGTVLCQAGDALSHVYFPVTSIISLIAQPGLGQKPLEMGLVGNEGMFGATIVLGVTAAPMQGVVQGAGAMLRVRQRDVRRALGSGRSALARLMARYLYVTFVQQLLLTTCLRSHGADERLARWLLMTHDRAHSDRFHLTHEFLASMLGVRRSTITLAAGNLARAHVISYQRGEIEVLSRPALAASSCACYQALADVYAKWLGKA